MIDDNSALIQVMAWGWLDSKPLTNEVNLKFVFTGMADHIDLNHTYLYFIYFLANEIKLKNITLYWLFQAN